MAKYFRITAYWPERDCSIIFDSYGMYEKLWEFSSFLSDKGLTIQEVSTEENMLDGNIDRLTETTTKPIVRAIEPGRPVYTPYIYQGRQYKGIQVDDMIYVPNKNK